VSGPVSSPVALDNTISDVTYLTQGLPSRYTVTDLGAFMPTGINASGQIAGNENSNAMLYSGGATTGLSLDPLLHYPSTSSTFGSVTSSYAEAINASGDVAGVATNASSGTTHGFMYYPTGDNRSVAFDLGALPGDNESRAVAINASGQAVGESDNSRGFIYHAFYWNGLSGGGMMTNLGTLGGLYSIAYGINASGQVIGSAASAAGTGYAFRWSVSGGMTGLGTLPGGSSSEAHAINDSGQIVGFSTIAARATHAFLYSSAMSDLGTLGGSSSRAAAINAAGQVVGSADTAAGAGHAFLYTGGTMNDLNSLIPAGSGWELQGAAGINDAGQIVGTGTINGQTHGFLLSVDNPTPSISSISPTSAPAGSAADLTLTVRGSGFTNGSTVEWNGAPLPTTFVDSAQLTAVVTASSLLATAGTAAVTVSSPAPGGGASTAQVFFVTATGTTITGVDSAVSASSTGTAIAATGGTTATATGSGTVTVAQYAANPVVALPPNPAGAYFDVNVASGSLFSALTMVDCNLGGGDTVYWWDASAAAWSLVSNQTYDAATQCVTITLNGVSAPSILQLTGTPFVAVRTEGSGGNGNSGTATPELGSGELLATGLLGLAGIALHALHRRRRKVNRRGQGRVRLLISARVIRNAPV